MPKLKILQVVRQYLPSTGGMETYVASLCRQLAARGHSTDVATLDYLFKTNEPLPHYERIDGIDVIRLPSLGNPRYFFAPSLLKMLPRYDLVHVHGVDFFVDMLGAFRKVHGTPVVLSTHGGFFHTPWFPALKRAYFHSVTRSVLKKVDRVIASSPQDQELFGKLTTNISLVENGIDYADFAAVRKRLSKGKIVFIGRLSKNKRIDRLLSVMAKVRESHPRATLTVVGPDWEGLQAGLEARAAALGINGAVTFTGAVTGEALLKSLASARLFVSASEYEAFGLSAVEAMATSTVPVLNRIPAFEGFINDGVNGFLADFTDTEAAAVTIRMALELPDRQLKELGAAAKETAARHDWDNIAGSILSIYSEVYSGHGH